MDEMILVLGTGQMGPGIALSCLLAGYTVVLSGRRHEGLAKALHDIETAAGVLIETELLTPDDWERARARLTAELGFGAAARSTYVVEAIAEDLPLKQAVLAQIEQIAPADAVLASTTSALSPSALQAGLRHPERLLVAHYLRPAHLMPICEVVLGEQTSEATVQRAWALLQRCGIRPVLCRDVAGFIFNRLNLALVREALALLRDDVASLEDIEATVKLALGPRLPAMGPFEYLDLSGLDLIATIATSVYPHLDCTQDPTSGPLAERLAQGLLGMKAGRGFHTWTGESAAQFVRQRDQELIRRHKIWREQDGPVTNADDRTGMGE
jgi:3-hydroxybutyryl-CoA dehydrogenase